MSIAHPLTSAVSTGFVVMSIGDSAAQLCSPERTGSVDRRRLLTCASYNGLVSPLFYQWYVVMDRVLPGVAARTLVPKVLLSQLVTTGLNNPGFLSWKNSVEAWVACAPGDEVDWARVRERTLAQCHEKLPTLYGVSMLFWLPITACNYALMPGHLRVLWVSTASVLWGAFVSYVAHRHEERRGSEGGLRRRAESGELCMPTPPR